MSGDFISDKTTIIQSEPLTPAMMWNVAKSVFSVGKYSDVNGLPLSQDLFFSKCALCFLSQRVEFPFVFLLFLFSALLVSENSHKVERR